MDYKLIVSKDAHRDIDDTIEYMLSILKSSQAAKGFLDDIKKVTVHLLKILIYMPFVLMNGYTVWAIEKLLSRIILCYIALMKI